MNPKKAKINPAKIKDKATSIKAIYLYLGIILFTFLIYGNSISNGYALDDDIVSRKNVFVKQGVAGIPNIFTHGFLYGFNGRNDQSYRPLALSSVGMEYQLLGANSKNLPHLHHFSNVLYYALCGIALFAFLRLIFKKYHFTIPLLITLLFLAHPIHTEVVANIKSRDEILAFLFVITGFYFTLKYYDTGKINLLIAGGAFFLLALLSKESVLVMVALVPLIFWFFRDFHRKKVIVSTIAWLMVAVLYLIIRGRVLDTLTFGEEMTVFNNSIMAAKSFSEQLATEFLILGKYLKLLFIPYPLSYDYSFAQIPIASWQDFGSLLSVSLYLILGVYALIRMPKKDPISFGIIFFFITISLVSNIFIKIGSSMGERFMFTPSLGFIIAILFISFKIVRIDPSISVLKFPKAYLSIIAIILLVFTFITRARNSDWADNMTLFSTDINTVPNSARAHSSLAFEYVERGKLQNNAAQKKTDFNAAKLAYMESLKILPQNADCVYNLGYCYSLDGDRLEALNYYRKTIIIDSAFSRAHNNIGVYFYEEKSFDSALFYFESALKFDPAFADALGNIGAVYHNRADLKNAKDYYERALKINPQLKAVYNNLESIRKQNK